MVILSYILLNLRIIEKDISQIKLPNLDSDTIDNTIKEFSKLSIRFGNSSKHAIFSINILLNLYLCTLVGQKVETIDVEQFLSQHTDEEINSLIYRREDDKEIYNSKYIFDDKKAFYLDIPLCDDFYCNHEDYVGHKIITVTFPYIHDIRAEHNYPFTIEFEENISFFNENGDYGTDHSFNTTLFRNYVLKPNYDIIPNTYTSNNKYDNIPVLRACKYIFIIMDKNEINLVNLLNVKIYIQDDHGLKYYNIKLEHMIVTDCNNKYFYGINPRENSDMHNHVDDNLYIHAMALEFTTIEKSINFQVIYVTEIVENY
jgi:hypothetical protein